MSRTSRLSALPFAVLFAAAFAAPAAAQAPADKFAGIWALYNDQTGRAQTNWEMIITANGGRYQITETTTGGGIDNNSITAAGNELHYQRHQGFDGKGDQFTNDCRFILGQNGNRATELCVQRAQTPQEAAALNSWTQAKGVQFDQSPVQPGKVETMTFDRQ